MLKIVKKNVENRRFSTFFQLFFQHIFFNFFCIFEISCYCSLKWSLVAELFPYKWPSYRGFTAAKIVHLIAEIVPIQKIDPYIHTQLLEIHLNGHNFVSFEATISRFFMVIDLNDTYKMMMTLMMMIMIMMMLIMIMLIKIQNGQNWANFESTTSRFCMVTDLNDTYKMMIMMMTMMMMMIRMMKI